MWRYILKRLITTFFLLFAVVFIVYLIMEFTPGDPVMIKFGTNYTPDAYEATRQGLGLDKPFFTRYLLFVKDALFTGSFGTSYNGRDVIKEVLSRAPRSMIISFSAIIIASILGILFGITAAINHSKWRDNATMVVALFGISIPDFWRLGALDCFQPKTRLAACERFLRRKILDFTCNNLFVQHDGHYPDCNSEAFYDEN